MCYLLHGCEGCPLLAEALPFTRSVRLAVQEMKETLKELTARYNTGTALRTSRWQHSGERAPQPRQRGRAAGRVGPV